MTNYFDFYDLKPSFLLDEGMLKRQFYIKSKEYHPDFYTLESEEKQTEILGLSTLNNKAYKTLSDFQKRMHHVLDLNGLIEEEGKASLSQMFLMEMMDVNEAIMELQFDNDPDQKEKVLGDIQKFESEARSEIEAYLEGYDHDAPSPAHLKEIKDYYFKHKYLLRLEENLGKLG